MKGSILEFTQEFTHFKIILVFPLFFYQDPEFRDMPKNFFSQKHSIQTPSRRYVPQNFNLEGCSFDNLEKSATMKWKENIAGFLPLSSSAMKWDLNILLQIPLKSH